MPKGYVVFTEDIHDQEGLGVYAKAAGPTIGQSGAKVLVACDNAEVLEGKWHGQRTVIMEFESVDAARAWYESPDYQKAIPLRQAAAECNGVIVAGIG